MRQGAGELHFALEARDHLVGGARRLEQLDRAGPLQQVVAREVDVGHAAFADGALQAVGAELPLAAQLAAQAQQRKAGPERGRDRQHQRAEHDAEGDAQVAQRRVGLRGLDLDGHAETEVVQPAPGADHLRAARAGIGLQHRACRSRQSGFGPHAGHDEEGARAEAARREQLAVLVEGEQVAGRAGARGGEDLRQHAVGGFGNAQHGDHFVGFSVRVPRTGVAIQPKAGRFAQAAAGDSTRSASRNGRMKRDCPWNTGASSGRNAPPSAAARNTAGSAWR